MRNLTLYGLLEAFTTEAGMRLTAAADGGDEIPFEVAQAGARGRRTALYCYRPLTSEFIGQRLDLLTELPTYLPAARALESVGGTDAYLRARGDRLIPARPGDLAGAALRLFLNRVFEERSEFVFDDMRFAVVYEELERAIYQGRCVTEVVVPLLGIDLDPSTEELPLGEGLSILRPSALAGPPPALTGADQPSLLLVLRVAHERLEHPSATFIRTRFRRALTALRLYEKGGYALGTIGWSRLDDGNWSPVALGNGGRARLLTLIPANAEDELRGFCNLIGRRLPWAAGGHAPDYSGAGEVAWALSRYEMGCERSAPFEALTDYLLALRALLEPEGPDSGRLAQRLAVICAPPEERAALAERAANAITLERKVIAGLAPVLADVDLQVEEVGENLRAILRDILCGHLDADVRATADELLGEAAVATAAA